MNLIQTLTMAFKSIANNKMRSFLTMLGIIIGVASVIALVSVTQAQTQVYIAQMNAMGVNQISMFFWTGSTKIHDSLVEYCEKAVGNELTGMSPNTQTDLELKYRTKTMSSVSTVFGNEQYGMCSSNTVSMGRDLTETDIANRSRVCVIGEAVRKNFFGAMSPIGQSIRIGGQSYKVVGVYAGKFKGQRKTPDDMILVPYTLQRRLTGWEDDNSFIMRAKDTKTSIAFAEKLTAFGQSKIPPTTNNGYFYAQSNDQYQQQMQGMANQQSIVMGGIAGISLLVGGIGIMNIMLVTVTERTREIGIRMAIGARRRDIVGQFLIEAGVVSACGGILGIVLGYFVSQLLGTAMIAPMLNQPGMAQATISVAPSLVVILGAFLFSVLLGIVFGIYPANKASKMQPVDALRTQ